MLAKIAQKSANSVQSLLNLVRAGPIFAKFDSTNRAIRGSGLLGALRRSIGRSPRSAPNGISHRNGRSTLRLGPSLMHVRCLSRKPIRTDLAQTGACVGNVDRCGMESGENIDLHTEASRARIQNGDRPNATDQPTEAAAS